MRRSLPCCQASPLCPGGGPCTVWLCLPMLQKLSSHITQLWIPFSCLVLGQIYCIYSCCSELSLVAMLYFISPAAGSSREVTSPPCAVSRHDGTHVDTQYLWHILLRVDIGWPHTHTQGGAAEKLILTSRPASHRTGRWEDGINIADSPGKASPSVTAAGSKCAGLPLGALSRPFF